MHFLAKLVFGVSVSKLPSFTTTFDAYVASGRASCNYTLYSLPLIEFLIKINRVAFERYYLRGSSEELPLVKWSGR